MFVFGITLFSHQHIMPYHTPPVLPPQQHLLWHNLYSLWDNLYSLWHNLSLLATNVVTTPPTQILTDQEKFYLEIEYYVQQLFSKPKNIGINALIYVVICLLSLLFGMINRTAKLISFWLILSCFVIFIRNSYSMPLSDVWFLSLWTITAILNIVVGLGNKSNHLLDVFLALF